MIAVSIGNGSGDAQGSQRGLEYDTMSGLYAEFVESEVLPLVERQYKVRITKDPDARATMGCSSGGSAAMAMGWYRPDLYHRVLTYSGTYVNQQYPYNPETPGGAWEFHRTLIPKSPVKPLRIWMHVSDRDNFSESDGMHDWVLANQNMARELAARGYKYQFVFARNAGHCDRTVKAQTLPNALEFVWKGYPVTKKLSSKYMKKIQRHTRDGRCHRRRRHGGAGRAGSATADSGRDDPAPQPALPTVLRRRPGPERTGLCQSNRIAGRRDAAR